MTIASSSSNSIEQKMISDATPQQAVLQTSLSGASSKKAAAQTGFLSLDIPIASPEGEFNIYLDQHDASAQRQQQQPKKRRTTYSCKAIVSLVCAIASVPLYFFWYPFGWLVGSTAVCLAMTALYEIKLAKAAKTDQEVIMGGKCMATAGLIISILGFILSTIVIITIIILSSINASSPASTTYTYQD
jgi:hypothetical protein